MHNIRMRRSTQKNTIYKGIALPLATRLEVCTRDDYFDSETISACKTDRFTNKYFLILISHTRETLFRPRATF
jgi:hypothetical protein